MKDDNNSKPAAPRKRKDSRKEKGGAGEQAAVQYLKQQGYDIMDTNWRCKSGELDIVAQKGGTTIFAEVRSRTSLDRFGTHLESVNLRKKLRYAVPQPYIFKNANYTIVPFALMS